MTEICRERTVLVYRESTGSCHGLRVWSTMTLVNNRLWRNNNNTLKPGQNRGHLQTLSIDFLNTSVQIAIKISFKFVQLTICHHVLI